MDNTLDFSVSSVSTTTNKVKHHRELLSDFLKTYAEFNSENALHKYYIALENDPASDKYIIEFWKDVLDNY